MTSIKKFIKRELGKALIIVCDCLPAMKRSFKPWGMRTSKEWFGRRVVRVQMPGGRSFSLASVRENYLSFELFWKGAAYYEPITTLVLQELVRPGHTFLDIGANIGFYSLVLSARQPQLDVVAFEPNPRLWQWLQENATVNNFDRIRCEPLALSDESGPAKLYLNRSDMSASLRNDFDSNLTEAVEVQTTSLDNYLNRQRVRGRFVIKVDVEGNEEAFFEGARQALAFSKPDIIAEVAMNYGANTMALLRKNGYRFYKITDQGLLESEFLCPVVREPFVFLNYLLSTKPPAEIAALFSRIEGRVRAIDLTQTSKLADPHAVEQMKARQMQSQVAA